MTKQSIKEQLKRDVEKIEEFGLENEVSRTNLSWIKKERKETRDNYEGDVERYLKELEDRGDYNF